MNSEPGHASRFRAIRWPEINNFKECNKIDNVQGGSEYSFRHLGTKNVLWLDAHVGSIRLGDVDDALSLKPGR